MNNLITEAGLKAIKRRVRQLLDVETERRRQSDKDEGRKYLRVYTRKELFSNLGIDDLYYYYNYITTENPREDYRYKSARYYRLLEALKLIKKI